MTGGGDWRLGASADLAFNPIHHPAKLDGVLWLCYLRPRPPRNSGRRGLSSERRIRLFDIPKQADGIGGAKEPHTIMSLE